MLRMYIHSYTTALTYELHGKTQRYYVYNLLTSHSHEEGGGWLDCGVGGFRGSKIPTRELVGGFGLTAVR